MSASDTSPQQKIETVLAAKEHREPGGSGKVETNLETPRGVTGKE
jgi:hypothetical protein